jgi:DNA-binding beta-propeller fold protein YncE
LFSALTDTLTLCPCACCVQSQNGTRYVRVEHSGEYLHMQQIQVFAEGSEENIALGGVASMSTSVYDGNAERVIDGDTVGDMNPDADETSCCHTDNGANEWVVIDLQREYVVTKVVVHNRPDGWQYRLAGARVLLQRDASDAGREIGVLTAGQVQELRTVRTRPFVPAY